MNILIRLPNWLGDAIMATFAIESLYKTYKDSNFFLVGSKVSIQIFKNHENTTLIEDDSKDSKCRILKLYKIAKSIPRSDIAITFQNNFLSALFLSFNNAKIKIGYKNELRQFLLTHAKIKQKGIHEVFVYYDLVKDMVENIQPKLYLQNPNKPINLPQGKLAGINAGAAFGSAKRWEESYFAEVANYLLDNNYSILLFGSNNEINIANNIESMCKDKVLNLAGQTTLEELITYISKLDLFITNDSGPMHIAAAFNIPSVAIFGPTNDRETSPFSQNSHIISLKTLGYKLECQPCKKRICPLKDLNYHSCMRDLKPKFIIEKIKSITKT